MTREQLHTMMGAALTDHDRDAYVSDWALSSIWGVEADNDTDDAVTQRAQMCGKVWDAAHATARDIRKAAGLTQAAFAARYYIPKRTIENWEGGQSNPPDYVRLLLAEQVGMLDGLVD